MNTVHPHANGNCNSNVRIHVHDHDHGSRFDWAGQIKLAIVLSVVAAITAIALADRVAEPVLIVGVIIVASFAGWARVQPAPQPRLLPIRIPVRRR